MFETIIVGYDGSTRAEDALTLASALASEQTELVLCAVQPVVPAVVPGDPGVPARDAAEERLAAARERLADRFRVRTVAVAAPSPASALHGLAADEHADLLVVGSSNRGAVGRILLGSTTTQVLSAPPCAVAVAPVGLHDAGLEIREITVAFDGGDESRAALATAADLARERGGKLRVITVIEPVGEALGWATAYVYPEYREDLIAIAREQLEKATRDLERELDVTTQIVEGLAVQELVLASSRTDLLVLGSRGYGPARRVLLGSVSSRVAAAAAGPLLIVPRTAVDGDGS